MLIHHPPLLCVVVHVNPVHMPFFNSCRSDKSHRRQRRISLFGDLYAHSPDLTCLGDTLDMKFTPPPRNKGARSEMSKRVLKPSSGKRRLRIEKKAVEGSNSTARNILSPTNGAYSYLKYTTVKVNPNAFLKKRKTRAMIPYDSTTQAFSKRRRRRSFSNRDSVTVSTPTPSAPPATAFKSSIRRESRTRFTALFQMFDKALSNELENFQSKANEAVNKISERLSKVYGQYKFAQKLRRSNNGHNNKNNREATPLLVGKVVRMSKSRAQFICTGSSV